MTEKKNQPKQVRKAYILFVMPACYSQGFWLVFDKYPTVEAAVEALKEEAKLLRVTPEFREEMLKICTTGVTLHGIPKYADLNVPTEQHWKVKGESQYSTKGYTRLYVQNIYEVGNVKSRSPKWK